MKYKLKKIRISRGEKGIILSLVLLIALTVLLYPEDTHNDPVFKHVINPQKVIASFRFEGTKTHEQIFDNKYANVVYEDENNNFDSYLIDVVEEKEVEINEFLKLDKIGLFNDKINELLLLKYPREVVDELHKVKAKYIFYEYYLIVYYDDPTLETKYNRKFDLYVNYNEIYDYLNFEVMIEDEYYNEDGYALLDPLKTTVIFTFDDGPTGERTTKIVDLLENYKMSATFFMVGNKLAPNEYEVKYVHNSHSEVAYHSFAHESFTAQTTEQIKQEFEIANNTLKQIIGEGFKYTRPPYGNYDERVLNSIDNAFFRWNIDTNDWRYKDADYIYNHVLEELKDGSIILFHDSYDTTVESVSRLLKTLYERNIQVVSLTDYANLRGITYENNEVYYSFVKK